MEGSSEGGYTCDTPDNCFTPSSTTQQLPQGQRIDYIFYRANDCKYHDSSLQTIIPYRKNNSHLNLNFA